MEFINRALPYNGFLFKISTLSSPLCSFCKEQDETFIHLFWDCTLVKQLWDKLIQWCKIHVDADFNYSQSACLLVGDPNNPTLNNIFLRCKYFIHIQRLFHGWLDFDVFLRRVKSWRFRDRNAIYALPYLKQGKYLIHWGHIPEIAFRT